MTNLELDLLDVADELGTLPPGAQIGSYRIIGVLGEGGMGRVYVAEHVKLGRRVAIKKLRPELASNPTAVARFFAEARAVNRISHENIVEITDLLQEPSGDSCIIMELLKGEDLAHRLLRKRVLPLPRAFDIAAQVASALAAVHAAGMIHRDLKPDNIFLIERHGNPDFVKVLDFGVAKLTDPNDRSGFAVHTTAAGQIIGTPEYMSPEQASGKAVDFRTDIYALGVIFYEMITGVLPFQGKSFGELMIKHMTAAVDLPALQPGLPHGIQGGRDQLLLDLLAKDPNDRPRSMADVEARIRALLEAMDLPQPPRRRGVSSGELSTIDRSETLRGPAMKKLLELSKTTETVAKLALVKRSTPQAVVEVATPRSVSRIEVATPSGSRLELSVARANGPPVASGQPERLARPAERLAKSSSDLEGPDPSRARLARSSSESGREVTPSEIARPPIDPTGGLAPRPAGRAVGGPTPDDLASPIDPTGGLARRAAGRAVGGPTPDDLASPIDPTGGLARRPAGRAVPTPSPIVTWRNTPSPATAAARRVTGGPVLESQPAGRAVGVPSLDALASPTVASDATPVGPASEPRRPTPPPGSVTAPRATATPVVEVRTDAGSEATVVGRRSATARPVVEVAPDPEPSPELPQPAHEVTPPAARGWRVVVLGGLGLLVVAAAVAVLVLRPGAGASPSTGASPGVGPGAAPGPAGVSAVQPREIKIKFVSAPPGATVRMIGSDEQLGVTPFTHSFPHSPHVVTFEFVKPGFATVTQDITLAADDALAAALTPAEPPSPPLPAAAPPSPPVTPPPAAKPDVPRRPAPARRPPPPSPERPVDRNGTLDVFKRT